LRFGSEKMLSPLLVLPLELKDRERRLVAREGEEARRGLRARDREGRCEEARGLEVGDIVGDGWLYFESVSDQQIFMGPDTHTKSCVFVEKS
jgi:hypothetical protein